MKKSLKHEKFVYEVSLDNIAISFVFQDQNDAVDYCKANYSNTHFQIVPIPVFSFKSED